LGGGDWDLELIVLGSGTSIPVPGRSPAGYIVTVSGEHLAFDLGPGTVHRWPEVGISCRDIEDVYISHLHLDHVSDMATLLFALRNHPRKRTKPLRVTGGKGLMDYYRGLLHLYGHWVEEMGYELRIHEIGEGTVERGNYRVIARRVRHTSSSLGYRVESGGGKVFVYSGDTDYCEEIVELGRGADLLLLECSFPEEMRLEGHLTPTLAGKIAAECGVDKLALTHFYPLFEGIDIASRVRELYGGKVVLAEDMMRIQI
jgi:ribonuclease BN (tRNA processing enzyme)